MKLYVIRHGQSETNLSGCYTGWCDVPLTEAGECDALFARRVLSGVKFDRVFSSDLSRAVRTAKIALPDCTPELTPLLREFDVGSLANKPITSLTEDMRASILKGGFADFGGEGRREFNKRVEEFMTLAAECGGECIAAFSHNGFIRSMLEAVLGVSIPRKNLACGNCAVAVFEYEGGAWRLHSLFNK